MILTDIVLAMSFKNITLDAARLARYFVQLISDISTNIFLHHAQVIQFYITIMQNSGEGGIEILKIYFICGSLLVGVTRKMLKGEKWPLL